jgi:hypothetical protein
VAQEANAGLLAVTVVMCGPAQYAVAAAMALLSLVVGLSIHGPAQ